jgi:hypothetical protein
MGQIVSSFKIINAIAITYSLYGLVEADAANIDWLERLDLKRSLQKLNSFYDPIFTANTLHAPPSGESILEIILHAEGAAADYSNVETIDGNAIAAAMKMHAGPIPGVLFPRRRI